MGGAADWPRLRDAHHRHLHGRYFRKLFAGEHADRVCIGDSYWTSSAKAIPKVFGRNSIVFSSLSALRGSRDEASRTPGAPGIVHVDPERGGRRPYPDRIRPVRPQRLGNANLSPRAAIMLLSDATRPPSPLVASTALYQIPASFRCGCRFPFRGCPIETVTPPR